jgi:predicted unusual protein kinase regulating ubiquinone biosynthesis (AarF/ABC1/UbiB family)
MEAARKIRNAVTRVSTLRHAFTANSALREAVSQVKRVQARRFAGTYADLLAGGSYSLASRFFLDELYSDKDYAERDAQFARIAGAIERFFPHQVVTTAVALAELHALTEELDQTMALSWLRLDDQLDDAQRYVMAWREVGRRAEREMQLVDVLAIGHEMAKLTRAPGLRTLLKMMRGPAAAAGLGSLQRFLETGFDTFAAMARRRGEVEQFLGTIQTRESLLIAMLFDSAAVASETEMARILGQAP